MSSRHGLRIFPAHGVLQTIVVWWTGFVIPPKPPFMIMKGVSGVSQTPTPPFYQPFRSRASSLCSIDRLISLARRPAPLLFCKTFFGSSTISAELLALAQQTGLTPLG